MISLSIVTDQSQLVLRLQPKPLLPQAIYGRGDAAPNRQPQLLRAIADRAPGVETAVAVEFGLRAG